MQRYHYIFLKQMGISLYDDLIANSMYYVLENVKDERKENLFEWFE